jgi:hypothetical protein
MATIIAEITRKSETEHGWRHALRLNDQQVVVGFWWQSPIQASFLCCASFVVTGF